MTALTFYALSAALWLTALVTFVPWPLLVAAPIALGVYGVVYDLRRSAVSR